MRYQELLFSATVLGAAIALHNCRHADEYALRTVDLEQLRRPCRPRHPYAVPRTSLQCDCTRRRNCIAQLSPCRRICASDCRFRSAPQTVQTASPVCGTKNFSSVRLYSAPQLHCTIVAMQTNMRFGLSI